MANKGAIAQGYLIHPARAHSRERKQRQQRGAPVSTACSLPGLMLHPPTLTIATIPKFSPQRALGIGHPD